MTRAEIKAELRRSACEDENPWSIGSEAFCVTFHFRGAYETFSTVDRTTMRIMYLLVAEAL